MNLKGKIAIVTGGNSGIGLAIVLELARQGASIVIDYVSHPEATDALEKQVAVLRVQAIGVEADVSKVADLQKLVTAAVANSSAGWTFWLTMPASKPAHQFSTRPKSNTRRSWRINLKSAFFGTEFAAQSDDQARERGQHHQHHLRARGLADAGQHRRIVCRKAACGC